MSNAQHSSRSDAWGTPQSVLDRVRMVLGEIDFDPASSELFNSRVRAKSFITKEQDGLSSEWPADCNVFCNPPGGKTGNESNMALFWERLCVHALTGCMTHAIFMAFSLESLQVTQRSVAPMAFFPLCIPRKRIAFETPEGVPGMAPTHSNVIVYVPCKVDKTLQFANEFSSLGAVLNVVKK